MSASDNSSSPLFERACGRPADRPSSLGRRSARRRRAGRVLASAAVAGAGLLAAGAVTAQAASPVRTAAPAHPATLLGTPAPVHAATVAHTSAPVQAATPVHATALSSYPMVGMAPTPDGRGYWMAASDGGVFTFGDATFHGSLGGLALHRPIVGMAATPDGGGYWLVASDGGVFAFGDAGYYGSLGGMALDKPIVGIAATPDGHGYWLVASDGGVFAFGDAGYYGSTGGMALAKPVVGMASTPDGQGYWLVASDGGIFSFGDAGFHGSAVGFNAAGGAASVGVMAVGSGYWIPDNLGQVASLGAPAAPSPAAPIVNTVAPAAVTVLPAGQNPAASVAPSQAQMDACWVPNPDIAACNAAALADINRARAGEGLGPLSLPANFYSLGTTAQLVAVADAERTSRGLPALPENPALDTLAAAGAAAGLDPTGPAGYSWGSNIAWGDPTPLAADFGWMYDDGPGSPNIDCPTAGSPGCWGHRENILAPWGGAAGAGVYVNNGTVQLTQLFVRNY